LDQYLTNTQPTEDSISIEDYMSRWCNIVQTPNSPTPQENHHTTQLFSSEEKEKDQFQENYSQEEAIKRHFFQAFDEPISEDELAEWSNDIDLFVEGLTNPDKLETLWKKSKAKKL